MKKASFLLIYCFSFLSLGALAKKVLADPLPDSVDAGLQGVAATAYPGVTNPPSPVTVVSNIINYALGLMGIIFLILVIYGGLLWMTSGGDEKKVTTARQIITTATIGLAIVLAAYAITWFITTQLLTATGTA